jgi:hypothetical protein
VLLFVASAVGQHQRKQNGGDDQAVAQLATAASKLSPKAQLVLVDALVRNMQFYVGKPTGKVHKPTCPHANLDGRSEPFLNAQAVVQAAREFCSDCCKDLALQQKTAKGKR